MNHVFSRHLYLLRQLSSRDLAQRYKGTWGGLLWVAVQPLLMLAVYTVVFGVIFRPRWVGLDSVWDYALVIFLGKIPYIFLLETVGRAPGLITGHVSYVKKLAFPLEVLPWMSHLTATAVAGISLAVWLLFAIIIRQEFPWQVALMPIVYLPMFVTLLGVSYFISSLGTYFKDVGQVVQPILFAMMFLSPVFYPLEMAPRIMRQVMLLNPLTLPIEQSRGLLLFGAPLDYPYLIAQLLFGFVVLALGYAWFQRTRDGFAEVL